jgi:hypothetical protein
MNQRSTGDLQAIYGAKGNFTRPLGTGGTVKPARQRFSISVITTFFIFAKNVSTQGDSTSLVDGNIFDIFTFSNKKQTWEKEIRKRKEVKSPLDLMEIAAYTRWQYRRSKPMKKRRQGKRKLRKLKNRSAIV